MLPAAVIAFVAVTSTGPAADGPADATASRPAQTLDEKLLFQPLKHPAGDWQPRELRFEDVFFEADDGVRLHGWYCPAVQPQAAVLYLHGNAGNITHRAGLVRYLQDQLGLTVLIFDYRGYGRSDGVPTVEGVLRDARAARALLAERANVRAGDVILWGRSLGGALGVQLAADAPPRALILEGTFSSLRETAAHHYGTVLAKVVPAERLNSVDAITKFKGPLLQSHGDSDRVVPYALGRKLFDAAGGQKRFIRLRGLDHNDWPPEDYYRQVSAFVRGLDHPADPSER